MFYLTKRFSLFFDTQENIKIFIWIFEISYVEYIQNKKKFSSNNVQFI